jgi:FixJ family two-component response regulator
LSVADAALHQGAVARIRREGDDPNGFLAMEAHHENPTVFLVEDDVMVLRALARFLRSAGHVVETFASAEEFLARKPVAEDGLLLLDVSMPGTSGPQLQTLLRARGSRLQFHFMSALDDRSVREAVLGAGARSWFTKPIDGDALLAALAAPPHASPAAC